MLNKIRRAGLQLVLKVLRKFRLSSPVKHFLTGAGYLRYVQNTREIGNRKNPDDYVRYFLSSGEKLMAIWDDMEAIRRNPFYHYLLARTKFYDKIMLDSLSTGFRQVVIFGVGTDSRSFRFKKELVKGTVKVIESDLHPWISQRAALTKRLEGPAGLRQLELDLERDDLSDWAEEANFDHTLKTLFIIEGVTPYLVPTAVESLLWFISQNALAGSRLAYDFKLFESGKNADANTEKGKFRMPVESSQIRDFHNQLGFDIETILLGEDAQKIFLDYGAPYFHQDGIIQASVRDVSKIQ